MVAWMTRDSFSADAAGLLGTRGWSRDPELLEPWLTDWRGRYRGRAIGMASPEDTQSVAAFVRLCADRRVAIVPQGGNSSMSGGATPDGSGRSVLLSLRRLDAIGPVDRAARLVACGAGVVLQALHEAAEAEGLRFPLTLGGKGSATIGGLIATNAGGTQVLRHGTMAAQVAGLEAVLADGSVLDLMSPLRKDNRGFDLKALLIGSEGTLGVVTTARLRLKPAVRERAVAWIGLASVHEARALLLRCEDALGVALEGFEIVPASALEAVLEYELSARRPLAETHAWNVLIETVASDDTAPSDRLARVLAAAAEVGLIGDAALAANEAQAEAFWRLRDAISGAERARGPAVQHDVSVPVAAMPDFIEEASRTVEQAFRGTEAMAFGHLGDGNVHFHVRAPEDVEATDWQEEQAPAISRFVHDRVIEAGGSISAEHGIGRMKVSELERTSDPARLSVLRAVKRALDPQGILNPGALLAPSRPSD